MSSIVGNTTFTPNTPFNVTLSNGANIVGLIIANKSGYEFWVTPENCDTKTLYPGTADFFATTRAWSGVVFFAPTGQTLPNVQNYPARQISFEAVYRSDAFDPSRYPMSIAAIQAVSPTASGKPLFTAQFGVGSSAGNVQTLNIFNPPNSGVTAEFHAAKVFTNSPGVPQAILAYITGADLNLATAVTPHSHTASATPPTSVMHCTALDGAGQGGTSIETARTTGSTSNETTDLLQFPDKTTLFPGNNLLLVCSDTSAAHTVQLSIKWSEDQAPAPVIAATGAGTGIAASVNITDQGGKGDDFTDNTIPFLNSQGALGSAGGEIVLPQGIYQTGPLPLLSNIVYVGPGTIKLKNGANADLFSGQVGSINLSATPGTGPQGTLFNFGFRNITLDGNKANQSGTSYVLRYYGYGTRFQNVMIQNGLSGNVLKDWNGAATPFAPYGFEDQWDNVKIFASGGIHLQIGGPSDSQHTNMEVRGFDSNLGVNTGLHGIHLAPNAGAQQFVNCHVCCLKTGVSAVGWLIESASNMFHSCEAEGSDTLEVAMLANGNNWFGGRIFTAGLSVSGLKIGQLAGETPIPSQILQAAGVTTAQLVGGCNFFGAINNCEGVNGSVWFDNDNGNLIVADIFNTTGVYTTGARNASTTFINLGRGLTADGTVAKTPALIQGNAGIQWGTFKGVKSATVPTLANNGTIATAGVHMSRVTTAGNVTGAILGGGVFDDQHVVVVNESGNTITFDVSGTSHVAGGTGVIIAANRSQLFVWDTTGNLWY